jgi:hypothetical protein
MNKTLLLILAFCYSCTSPNYHFKNGNFEKSFDLAVKKINKKPKKSMKYEKVLLTSFTMLNKKELLQISDKNYQNFDAKFLRLGILKKRQTSLSDLSYYLNINDITKVKGWADSDSLENAISKEAYSYFRSKYENNFDSLEKNKIKYAPVLSLYVSKMEKYRGTEHDYGMLNLDLISRGVLKTNVSFSNFSNVNQFENLIKEYDVHKMSSQWFSYYFNEVDGNCDRNFIIEIGDVHPGNQSINTYSTTHTKNVIDHYKEVCVQVEVPQPDKRETRKVMQGDSVVEVTVCVPQPSIYVTERRQEPVYVCVSATVTTTQVSKVASAKVYFTLEHAKDSTLIFEEEEIIFNSYSRDYNEVSGDLRAIDKMPHCDYSSHTAPSDEIMIVGLSNIVYNTIQEKAKQLNKNQKKKT